MVVVVVVVVVDEYQGKVGMERPSTLLYANARYVTVDDTGRHGGALPTNEGVLPPDSPSHDAGLQLASTVVLDTAKGRSPS